MEIRRAMYDLKTFKLTTEYQQFEIIAEAPPQTVIATLIMGGGTEQETICLDDVFFGEAAK